MTTSSTPIICLMGPTASGKTQLAIELVKHFPFEIISVDSAMVYKGMDIGTAKPSADILAIAPHRLINFLDPKEPYSAGQFRLDALREINDIIAHGKIPLLVGGTMLYFRALKHGLAQLPQANAMIRAQLQARAEQVGWETLHAELAVIDPKAAARIHKNDSQRIQRALEVFLLTGKTISSQQENTDTLSQYVFYDLILAPQDRAFLHEKIALRFQQMLAQGLVDEVKKLYDRGDLSPDLPAMRAVGYREVWQYLAGQLTYDDMTAQAIAATRQLAKRQLTWLRSLKKAEWFASEDAQSINKISAYLTSTVPYLK